VLFGWRESSSCTELRTAHCQLSSSLLAKLFLPFDTLEVSERCIIQSLLPIYHQIKRVDRTKVHLKWIQGLKAKALEYLILFFLEY
jgi:hypothetical protein